MSHETNTNKRGSAVDETNTDRGQDDMPAVPRGWWDLDYRAWAMKDNWTVYEAIEIVTSRVIEPDVESKMRKDALADYRYADSETEALREDIVAALEMGKDAPFEYKPKKANPRKKGKIRVVPRTFIPWAVSKGFVVPAGLVKALSLVNSKCAGHRKKTKTGEHEAQSEMPPVPGRQTMAANEARTRNSLHKRHKILEVAARVAREDVAQTRVRGKDGRLIATRLALELNDRSHEFFEADSPPLSSDRIVREVLRPAIKEGTLR